MKRFFKTFETGHDCQCASRDHAKTALAILSKMLSKFLLPKLRCLRKAEKNELMSLARLRDNHRRVAQDKVGALSRRDYHNSIQ